MLIGPVCPAFGLDLIGQRTCVAPYFIEYGNGKKNEINDKLSNSKGITKIKADFMEYQLPHNKMFDLLLCNQVLKHVPDPAVFMKKLYPRQKRQSFRYHMIGWTAGRCAITSPII